MDERRDLVETAPQATGGGPQPAYTGASRRPKRRMSRLAEYAPERRIEAPGIGDGEQLVNPRISGDAGRYRRSVSSGLFGIGSQRAVPARRRRRLNPGRVTSP